MSNYAKIIVCWAGIDELAHDAVKRFSEIERLVALDESYQRLDPFKISFSAADGPQDADGNYTQSTMACETVGVTCSKGFDPDVLLRVLRDLPWEHPDQVEFFWKNEEMDRYWAVHLGDATGWFPDKWEYFCA